MTTVPVRLGLLGCASIALRRFLPALGRVPALRLVAVASRDPGRASRVCAEYGGEPAAGYHELLARDDVDAVYLPVPTGLHHHWAAAALQAGKHVLVEKPATPGAALTADLQALARRRGLVFAENFTFLHHSQHRLAADLLAGGEIGELREIEATFGIPPLHGDDVRYRPDLAGGCLLDVGVYPIRMAQWFLGDGLRVCGATGRADERTGVDVAGAALLSTPDGVVARLGYGFAHHYRNRYVLWGSGGAIVVGWAFSPPPHHRAVVRVERPNGTVEHVLDPEDQFATAAAAFARAVRGEADPRAAGTMLGTARLVDAIRTTAGLADPAPAPAVPQIPGQRRLVPENPPKRGSTMTSVAVQPDVAAMLRLTQLGDYATPLAIRAVNELGVPDQLASGPRSVEELAEATGAYAPSLYRAMRALSCQGVFVEGPPRVFALTPISELLRSDHPYSMRTHYQMMVEDVQAWAQVDHTMRTPGWSFELVHGQSYWKYLDSHPEYKAKFEATMAGMTRHELDAILPRYPWADIELLVDVGGGTGQMIAGLLAPHPRMRGVMFDLPHVAPHSRRTLEAAGVADRCTIVGGDFFQAVPEGGDAYLLKRVLYDFSDEEAVRILGNVRRAMRPDGRVLTLDGIVRPDNRFDVCKLHDLFILPLGPGRCRTRKEMATLFERSGLTLTRVIQSPIFPLVEARATP